MSMFWHVPEQPGQDRQKLIALALLAVPAVGLLLFTFGEMFGGNITGVQHIPEAALLFLIMAAAWRYPREVGAVLLSIGSLLLAVWLFWVLTQREPAPREADILMWVAATLILFAPPLVAGSLLLRSSHARRFP
jgi:cytochrome bd-type quinol oxidase subunit 1